MEGEFQPLADYPLLHFLGIACGLLGWSPDSYWNATTREFWASVEARIDANRVEEKPKPGESQYKSKISREKTVQIGKQLQEIQEWEEEQERLRRKEN